MAVLPILIALASMARVENHISSSKVQACLVPPNLALLAKHPVLVTPLVVARPQTHWLVQVLSFSRAVNALVAPFISCFSTGNCLARYKQFRIDLIEEPLEAFTLKLVAKFLPRGDVSKVTKIVPDPVIVILFIVVQPNLS
jgi:hypothetical protein